MLTQPEELNSELAKAVRKFWLTRKKQAAKQSRASGRSDKGGRTAVTGGAQMDGFVDIVRRIVEEAGIDNSAIFWRDRKIVPGFYRAEKEWDLVVVASGELLASVEFKSQVGPSFGNNFNNRSEEAIGSATDLWAAYREGAFPVHPRPWLGYVMLLEDCPKSRQPIAVKKPHFDVFQEFKSASYARRYEELLRRLVRDRLYDSASLILSDSQGGRKGRFSEPVSDLTFLGFAHSLFAAAIAHSKRTHP